MSLDLAKLQNVREQGGKTIARCPACAERGMDETGEHLIIQADGRFGCVVHPGATGKPHRQRIAKLVGTRGVPVIKVRVAAPAPTNVGAPLPIMQRPIEPSPKPHSEPRPSLRNETRPQPQLAPPVYSLECGEPNFREPEKGEWVVGLYREDDGTPVPLLLWADPKVDLFWDVSLREHVMPPRLYLKLDKQPQIDAATGYPVIQGAVCPF